MGLKSLFQRQLSQVIQWKQQDSNVLWEKYRSNNNDEIKNASKLIVAPGQGCILVYEGNIVDIVTEGIFNLKTDNHPFITNLMRLRTQFESEHKLSLYFFRTTQQLNKSWGTSTLVKYEDPIYKMPVEVGFNGNLSFFIKAPQESFLQIVGNKEIYSVNEVKSLIASKIPEHIAKIVVKNRYAYSEIDAHLNDISQSLQVYLNENLSSLGIEVTDIKILGSAFDAGTKKRINHVSDISMDILAAEKAGISYSELEKLRALRDLAQNEGSGNLAGVGMEMGMGLALAKQLGALSPSNANDEDISSKLRKLKALRDEELITEEEFNQKKTELLNQL